MATFINTSYSNPTNCDNDNTNTATVDDFTVKTLKPNTPVVLAINSFDKLYAGGRRAWHSYAAVHSDFHITAFIAHNAFDGTPRHCCSPRTGVWIVGSCAGPLSTETLKLEVAEILYIAGLDNLSPTSQGNGHTVPYDYGYLWQRSTLEVCNQIVVNPGGNGHFDDGANNRSSSEANLKGFTSLSIWDVSGRLMGEFKAGDLENAGNLNQLVESRLQNMVPGIYFVRLVANGEITTQKIAVE